MYLAAGSYQSTWQHISKDQNLHQHFHENPKSGFTNEPTGLFCLPGLKMIFPYIFYTMAVLKCNSEYSHKTRKMYYTRCPRRKGQNFGRVFLMLKYTDITQNTYIQSWTVMEIMAREVWNFDSCYTLIDYQIHIKTGRNMWFL